MRTLLVFLVALSFSQPVFGQPGNALVRDLQGDWLRRENNRYIPYDGESARAIYLRLDSLMVNDSWLRVSDLYPFGVFVNQRLVADRNEGVVTLSLDSLAKHYTSPLLITVFEDGGIHSLKTTLLSKPKVTASHENLFLRRGNYFLDFALLAILGLSIYLTFLMGNNPRLAIDYFNASKLFSIQDREENLLAGRITSRINLLFYLFCCLFCSLIVLIILQMIRDPIPLSKHFVIQSTGQGFLQWMKLSVMIAMLLALKLVIVFSFAQLFGLKDVAALQYFHFIRALILAAGLIALVSLVNFIFKGSGGGLHYILLKMGAGLLILSALMMFLKLLAQTRYHFFHLFSYLCASEIIPLVILLKVLLY